MARYPKQVVFTTTDDQFARLQGELDRLREANPSLSRADLLREALDGGLAGAVRRLTPKRGRAGARS